MPTYQTTPYISWTFPDQAIAMNRKGVRPLAATDLPNQDMVVGHARSWAEDAREHALARLESNRLKEKGMLGHRDTTERSQRYKNNASQSQSHINGKFMDPSYQFTQTPSGLRGGTGLITKEGRAWAKRQLASRVQQLNAIETGDYSLGRPRPVDLNPKLDYIDAALSTFLDQWEAGAFPGSLIEAASRVVQELLKVGATISAGKLAEYVEVVARLQVQADRMAAVSGGPYTLKDEKKTVLRAVILILNRFQQLAEEIARVIDEPENVRAVVMEEVGSRMLRGATTEQMAPAPGRVPRGPYTPDVAPGRRPGMPF